MIPVFAMKRWLFWIFCTSRRRAGNAPANCADLNPLSYGYEAIFANEFSRINVSAPAPETT